MSVHGINAKNAFFSANERSKGEGKRKEEEGKGRGGKGERRKGKGNWKWSFGRNGKIRKRLSPKCLFTWTKVLWIFTWRIFLDLQTLFRIPWSTVRCLTLQPNAMPFFTRCAADFRKSVWNSRASVISLTTWTECHWKLPGRAFSLVSTRAMDYPAALNWTEGPTLNCVLMSERVLLWKTQLKLW